MLRSISLRRAFTLVELLVVIGIIAVLISVLLPAISSARRQAATTACAANLRNLGQAIAVYKAEHKGAYPFSYNKTDAGGTGAAQEGDAGNQGTYVWWSILRGVMRGRGAVMDNSVIMPNGSEATRFMEAFNCPMGVNRDAGCDYVSNPAVLLIWLDERPGSAVAHPQNKLVTRAPTDRTVPSDVAILMDGAEIAPNYNVQYVAGYGIGSGPGTAFGINVTTIGMLSTPKKPTWRYRGLSPADDVELGDGFAINPGLNKDTGIAGGAEPGAIRWRHKRNDAANFLFADGSVKSMDINKRKGNTTEWKGDVTRKMFRPKLPPGFRVIDYQAPSKVREIVESVL